MAFSNEDYLNLIIIFGECHKNISRTCELFTERYPNAQRPNRKTVRLVMKNLRNFGSFKTKVQKVKPMIDDENVGITVLGYFNASPTASLRDAQRDLGLSHTAIQRILKKYKYRPFSYNLVQHLEPEDNHRRLEFCEFILTRYAEDQQFLSKIIWSDEAKFSLNGLFNSKNSHYWADENPHLIRERRFQVSWSFNVYCAIKDNGVLCLKFYDDNLNGAEYANILRNTVEEAMENLPLHEYIRAWYQHDGAPAHSTYVADEILTDIFEDRWIANSGPFRWPPRSPDLAPLDYYIWGKIKSIIFATAPTTKDDMKERVREAFRNLDPDEIRRSVTEGLLHRVNKCLAANGQQFEHLNL